jgi:hypothetical protein
MYQNPSRHHSLLKAWCNDMTNSPDLDDIPEEPDLTGLLEPDAYDQ